MITHWYTLEEPCSYFMTMLGYSIFAPMSKDFYESEGGKFGAEFDSSASDYLYGKGPDSIAYCGPYVVTNATERIRSYSRQMSLLEQGQHQH